MISRRKLLRTAAGLLVPASAGFGISTQAGPRVVDATSDGAGDGGDGGGHAAWTQLTLPSLLVMGTRVVYVGSDGYLYAGTSTGGGIYRALVSALIADPTNVGSWTNLDSKWPTNAGRPMGVSCIAEGPGGEIFAGAGIDTSGAASTFCCVARLDPMTLKWRASNAYGPRYMTRSIDFDVNGHIWIAAQQGGIFKSTNDGARFSVVSADPYAAFGQPTGWIFGMSIIDSRIYWGGEGAINSVDLKFGSHIIEAATTAGGYGSNHFGVASDGTQTTAPTEIFATGRQHNTNGMTGQKKSGGVWSDINSPFSQYWICRVVLKGRGAHEYYISGRRAGGGGGVVRTTDGSTWNLYNTGLSSDSLDSATWMAIDPATNTLFLHTRDASKNYQIWMR